MQAQLEFPEGMGIVTEDRHPAQKVGIIPRMHQVVAHGKAPLETAVPGNRQHISVVGAAGVGDVLGEFQGFPLNCQLAPLYLLIKLISCQPRQLKVAKGMDSHVDTGLAHFLYLLPGQIFVKPVHKIRNQEDGGGHAILLQHRKGIFVVVTVAVIKGNQHRVFRQGRVPGQIGMELVRGDGVVAVIMQVCHLLFKDCCGNGQGIVILIVDLMIAEYGHSPGGFPFQAEKACQQHRYQQIKAN